jgi:hypothetical protein
VIEHGAWQRRRHLGNQTLFWLDADSKMRKAFPILMMIKVVLPFVKNFFGRKTIFRKKTFGQKTIFRKNSNRLNELSVK